MSKKEKTGSMITEKCYGRQPLLSKLGPQLRHSNTNTDVPSEVRRLRFILPGLTLESLNSVHRAFLGVTREI
jgi:hypothetical protein